MIWSFKATERLNYHPSRW